MMNVIGSKTHTDHAEDTEVATDEAAVAGQTSEEDTKNEEGTKIAVADSTIVEANVEADAMFKVNLRKTPTITCKRN